MDSNLLVNGDFENSSYTAGDWTRYVSGDNDVIGWDIGGHSIDLNYTHWSAAAGNYSIDLSGSDSGRLTQDFQTHIGQQYEVSFYMSGNYNGAPAAKSMRAIINDFSTNLIDQTFNFDSSSCSSSNMNYERKSFNFTATTNRTQIIFEDTTGLEYGAVIDNVAIIPISPSLGTGRAAEAGRVVMPDTGSVPGMVNVSFQHGYSEPPLVFVLPSEGGSEDYAIRIRNVTNTGFEMGMFETSPDDGSHSTVTVDYIAFEKGIHNVDGNVIEAGSVLTGFHQGKNTLDTRWDSRNFISSFSSTPAMITTIQTMNSTPTLSPPSLLDPWSVVALRNINNLGFEMALDRAETSIGDITHNEEIGYLAFSNSFTGNFTDLTGASIDFETLLTSDNITHNCQTVNFSNSYTSMPVVCASQNSRDGGDGGWIKRCSISTSAAGLKVQEDESADSEMSHTSEKAGMIAFSDVFVGFAAHAAWSVDHFEVTTVSGAGSTCTPTELRITACADAATPCTPLTTYVGAIDLATTSAHGSWSDSTTIPPSGTLTDSTTDDGIASYNYSLADAGVVYLLLDNSHADDLIVSSVDSTTSISGVSGTLSFRDNAFVITPSSYQSPVGKDLPLSVEVWRNDGVACSIATEYSGNVNLRAWINRSGALISSTAPDLESVSLPSSMPGSNNLSLTFVNGVATSTLSSTDVGQYGVNLLDDSSGFALSLSGNNQITGGSNQITQPPFGFDINTNNDADSANTFATNHNGSIFKTAGDNFIVSIRAVAWESADDANNDGVPDASSDLSNNTAIPSFGLESPVETVDITHTLNLPSPGTTGSLSGGLGIGGFSAGSRDVTLQYSEVGIIDLNVSLSDSNYLGAGNISSDLDQVGRFVPSHFVFSLPDVSESCISSGTDFSYMGQDFNIEFDFEAVNLSGIRTQNYEGNFAKLNATNSSDFLLSAYQNSPFQSLSGRFQQSSWTASISAGEGFVDASFHIDKDTSPDGPFTLNIATGMTDDDGIQFSGLDADVNNDSTMDGRLIGNTLQRFGRMFVENNYGAEVTPIQLSVRSEYYGSIGANQDFVTNTDDSCTPLVAGDVSMSNFTQNLSSGETVASILSWTNGTGFVELSAPGTGNTGGVTVTVDAPAWLEYDFKGSGEEDPSSLGNFGIYNNKKSNFIWMREVLR